MGHELHVTLAEDWAEAETRPIPEAEFRLDRPDPSRDMAGRPFGRDALWFDRGQITIKNPSEASVAKLKAIAQALGARLVGDDGEEC